MREMFSHRLEVCLTVILLLLSIVSASSVEAARMRKVRPLEVAADAPDSSVELVGYLSLPPKDKNIVNPPLVILLHQSNESSDSWLLMRDELLQTGHAVFAMDFRGNGLSTFDLKTQRVRPKNTYYVGEHMLYPDDVKFLMGKLIDQHHDKFDTTRLAIIGAEIGGTVGLMVAKDDPRVKYVALISPGMEYFGLRVFPVLREYDANRPVLFTYANKDIYSRETVQLISDLLGRPLDIYELDDFFHGNRLVNRNVNVRIRLQQDLRKYLSPQAN